MNDSLKTSGFASNEDTQRDRIVRYWPLAVAYLAVGLLAYARILGTFFVADDFAYLDVISRAHSPAVIFAPLAERYFRPAVVLVYFLNYQLSGLSPWTYHLSVVLIHVANAWLVFLLGRDLAPSRRPFAAALAGLLFLVFGGHAEAVSWIGGMADPLLTCCLLAALFLFNRGLDAVRPLPWLMGSWLAFAAALLTKESAAVFLGLAAAFTLLAKPGFPDWQRMRRAGLALAVPVVLLVGYFALRKVILGFAFVDLQGLGTNTHMASMARAFVLRSFFPQSDLLARIWTSRLDVYLLAPVACVLLWFVRRHDYRPLVLAALCFGLALAPVLPLSIAIARPDSERFIYLPSAFACLLLVFFLDAAVRRRWLVTAVVVMCSVGHLVALDRINRSWVAAAAATRGITTSFRELMRQHGEPGRPVFVLNVPDSVNGAFVYRRGFHDSLRLTAPDQLSKMGRTYVVSVYTILNPLLLPRVSQTGPTRFELSLGGGELIGGAPPPGVFYAIDGWSPGGFAADFTGAGARGLIVYFTPQEARLAAILPDAGLPFGVVDLPADGSACTGKEMTIAGWALDQDAVARVGIGVRPAGSTATPPVLIAEAQRMARPDVSAAYSGYVDSPLAGWIYAVQCATLAPYARDGKVELVVTAENRQGKSTTLGAKSVIVPR